MTYYSSLRGAESDGHAVRGNAEPSALARGNHAFPERPISRRRSDEAIQSTGAGIIPNFVLQDDSSTLVLFSIHFSFFYNGVFFTLFSQCDDFALFFKTGNSCAIFHVPCFFLSLYPFQHFFYSYLVGFFSYFGWKKYKFKINHKNSFYCFVCKISKRQNCNFLALSSSG